MQTSITRIHDPAKARAYFEEKRTRPRRGVGQSLQDKRRTALQQALELPIATRIKRASISNRSCPRNSSAFAAMDVGRRLVTVRSEQQRLRPKERPPCGRI